MCLCWVQCYCGLIGGTVLTWAYMGDSVKLGLCRGKLKVGLFGGQC